MNNHARVEWIMAFCIALGGSLLIWLASPFFIINHQAILLNLSNRVLAIIIFNLLFAVFFLYRHLYKSAQLVNTPTNNQVSSIVQLFKLAKHYLQRSKRWWQFFYNPAVMRSTFLMIGANDENNQNLLQQEFAHVSALQYPPLQHHQACTWWFNTQSILLSISSQSLQLTKKNQLANTIWQTTLQQLKKLKHSQPCQGLLIVVDLQELLLANDERRQQLILSLQQHIHLLNQYQHSSYPVYFMINQFDVLAGFIEFFGDHSREERQQIWGLHCDPARLTQHNFSRYLQDEFHKLIKKLNDRLIWRLHQERDLHKRCLIKDFPLQVESLEELIVDFTQRLFSECLLTQKVALQGIYFMSSHNSGQVIDRLYEPLSKAFALAPRQLITHHNESKPYFSHRLFHETIFPQRVNFSSQFAVRDWLDWRRVSAYALSTCAMITLAWYCAKGLSITTQSVNQAQTHLQQFDELSQKSSSDLNQSLNALNAITQVIQQLNNSTYSHFGKTRLTSLQQQAQKIYQLTLINQLLPNLRLLAHQQLFSVDVRNPQLIYQQLAIYLMLNNSKYYSAQAILNWLNPQLTAQGISVVNIDNYINQLAQLSFSNPSLDKHLVDTGQKLLNQLTYPQRCLLILTQRVQGKPLSLLSEHQDLFITPYAQIPFIYTRLGYEKLMQKDFQAAAKEALSGNWVLGENPNDTISPDQYQLVAKDAQRFYQQLYISLWQHVIYGTELKPVLTLSQAINAAKALSDTQSGFQQVIKIINDNTQVLLNDKNLDATFADNLQQLLNFSHSPAAQQLTNNLHTVVNELQKITVSPQPPVLSYALVKNRFLTNGNDPLHDLAIEEKQLPQPIAAWVQQIRSMTWHLLVAEAHDYINQQWQKSIVRFYQQNLYDRYPLAINAELQVSLNNFSTFFNPHGLLGQFYLDYLAPFINTSGKEWELVTLDGDTIGIDKSNLLQLQLSAFIAQMFFPNGDTSLHVTFGLQPIAIEPIVKKFEFSLDGQTLNYSNQQIPTAKNLIWPNVATDSPAAILKFTDINGNVSNKSYDGPWGFFKLLANMNIEKTDDPKQFIVTFDLNGDSAKYLLTTDSELNPFASNALVIFRLPENL
ncbi:MAG: hypothetical protein KIT27_10745 [Legionellales bacterium]|nr:hypothetical protein [Legionellales bacterium]